MLTSIFSTNLSREHFSEIWDLELRSSLSSLSHHLCSSSFDFNLFILDIDFLFIDRESFCFGCWNGCLDGDWNDVVLIVLGIFDHIIDVHEWWSVFNISDLFDLLIDEWSVNNFGLRSDNAVVSLDNFLFGRLIGGWSSCEWSFWCWSSTEWTFGGWLRTSSQWWVWSFSEGWGWSFNFDLLVFDINVSWSIVKCFSFGSWNSCLKGDGNDVVLIVLGVFNHVVEIETCRSILYVVDLFDLLIDEWSIYDFCLGSNDSIVSLDHALTGALVCSW